MLFHRFFIGILIGLSHGWVAAQTLNLGQLIQLAIDTHPSLQAQLSNEKSAQSGIETAQYQRYPHRHAQLADLFIKTSDQNFRDIAQRAIVPKLISTAGGTAWFEARTTLGSSTRIRASTRGLAKALGLCAAGCAGSALGRLQARDHVSA